MSLKALAPFDKKLRQWQGNPCRDLWPVEPEAPRSVMSFTITHSHNSCRWSALTS